METTVFLERDLFGGVIRQNSKTEMFNANDFHEIANKYRTSKGLHQKKLLNYFKTNETKELINELCFAENLQINDVKLVKTGKYGGTWLHPIIFIDLAMWYSPEFKVKILKWVMDSKILFRNNSGDSFKTMNETLKKAFPSYFESPIGYIKVSNKIAYICGVGAKQNKWETATEEQLKLREDLEQAITFLAEVSSNVGECISLATKKVIK